MKIIISPSKTQSFPSNMIYKETEYRFPDISEKILTRLKSLTIDDMSQLMKLKGDKLEATYNNYHHFEQLDSTPAIHSYTGLVYKGLSLDDYNDAMIDYMNTHLRILSAFYGILHPHDKIKPYRLDMKIKLFDSNLYKIWQVPIEDYFKDELIIDLASDEFSKMVALPKIKVGFRDYKDGKYKNVATYSKMARGQLLNLMITRQIEEIDALKSVEFNGYHYNDDLSSDSFIMFSRDI